MLVSEIIDRYLSHCQSSGVHGAEARGERLRTLSAFARAFGHLDVSTLMPHHLEDWIEGHPGWRSSSTKKAKANQVNAAFNWALAGRRITESPFRGVNYPEAERRPCLDDLSLAAIREHANKAFERAILFLRLTGCRLSELCALRWENIDFERRVVVIARHKTARKTGKPLVFALCADAMELLWKIKAEHFQDGEVFRNTKGKPWNRRLLGQQLRRTKRAIGDTSRASLHGLRHQFATSALRNGAPLIFVSKQLGHASTAITEKYYAHLDADIEGRLGAAEAGCPGQKRGKGG